MQTRALPVIRGNTELSGVEVRRWTATGGIGATRIDPASARGSMLAFFRSEPVHLHLNVLLQFLDDEIQVNAR